MRFGTFAQEGNIVTRSGAASGQAGKALAVIVGDGNSTGNSAGGALALKAGAGFGTAAAGSISLQPGSGATAGTTGAVQILPTKNAAGGTTSLQFQAINGTNFVAFKAADTIAANITWTLPATDGAANQVLQTNGSGVLSWNSPSVPNVFVNIAGNTGSAVADAAADTLTFTGTLGITTVASDASSNDVLTISLTKTGLSVKATPVAADSFLMFNSAASDTPVYATASTVATAIGALTAARIVRGTFANAGLTSGSIALNHNLAVAGVLVQVYDENNQLVQPDNITLTSNNVTTIDLSSFGTIAGTWSYVIFG